MKFKHLLTFIMCFCIFSAKSANVLLYGPMLSSAPNEKTIAEAAGHTVTVVNAAQWQAMTQQQFSSYAAIIIPDNGCGSNAGNSEQNLQILNSNKAVWSPAITGSKFFFGGDIIYHKEGQYQQIITNAINFVSEQGIGNTGLLYTTSCTFYNLTSNIDFLSNIVSITAGGSNCPGGYSIVQPPHPTMAGI